MKNLPKNKQIILFDGVCNLCNTAVQTIIKHDKNDVFRFVSLQSNLGMQLVDYLKIDNSKIDSIILYIPNKAYYLKSQAVIQISKQLNFGYKLLSFFEFTGSFFDFIYTYVAKNRYKWYGKKDSCLLPNKELLTKFL